MGCLHIDPGSEQTQSVVGELWVPLEQLDGLSAEHIGSPHRAAGGEVRAPAFAWGPRVSCAAFDGAGP